jgi:LPS export ABC transporter protein LptC
MKRLVKSLLLGVAIVLVYIMGSSILHFSSPTNNVPLIRRSAKDSQANLSLKGLRLTETEEDRVLWRMEADSALFFQQQRSAQFSNIKLTLYQEENPVLWLEGKEADFNMDSRDVTIEGQVVASSQDGLTFETNSLKWWNQKRIISTSDPVKISRPHIQIQGRGLEADLGLERLTISNSVYTVIN